MFERRLGKGLGEDVCHLIGGLHVFDVDRASAYVVSDEMSPDLNVLRSLVKDRVFRHLDASLVVFKDGDGSRAEVEVSQQLALPDGLLGGLRKRRVLSFSS